MSDKRKENDMPVMADPEPPSASKPGRYKKSAGDVAFDLGVYGGLGYIANAAISLVADRYGTQLKGSWLHRGGQVFESGAAKLYSTFMNSEKSVKYWSALSNRIMFLGIGGWALLYPMKWLEDRKVGIIRSTDELLGTGPKTEEGIQQQVEALDTGPRQSNTSLFFGRVFSYSVTIAAALPFISKWTNIGERFSIYLNKQLGPRLGGLSKPTKTFDSGAEVPEFIDSLSSEIILAGTAAALHFGASKGIAHAKHTITQPTNTTSKPSPILSQVAHAERVEAEPELEQITSR